MKTSKKAEKQKAIDDLFFSSVITAAGIYATVNNFSAGKWGMVALAVAMTIFGATWFAARVYQLFTIFKRPQS